MRQEALFINGVYEGVLQDIVACQALVPEQVLYLQPYSAQRIIKLYEWVPSIEHPVTLYLSTTEALETVSYSAEIVGIRDKSALTDGTADLIGRTIEAFQPTEDGVYMSARGIECRNLLSVLGMRKLEESFGVTDLQLLSTSEHASGPRSTAGGWWYVRQMGS